MASALALLCGLTLATGGETAAATKAAARSAPVLELDQRSEFSHIRVRRQGQVRSLVFVRDNGQEAEESQVNLARPHELMMPYSRFMFTSYVFRPQQQQVLIIGLGGGGMVHFLRHYDPQLRVEAVEIDPLVVEIATKYFGLRADDDHAKLITADGLKYLAQTTARYDVIYMDAFLKPAADTDATGVPLRMKTVQYYRDLQNKLHSGGLVVFNLNRHSHLENDLAVIRGAFAQVHVFPVHGGNLVAVGSSNPIRETTAALHARAKELDLRFKTNFSFQEMLSRMNR